VDAFARKVYGAKPLSLYQQGAAASGALVTASAAGTSLSPDPAAMAVAAAATVAAASSGGDALGRNGPQGRERRLMSGPSGSTRRPKERGEVHGDGDRRVGGHSYRTGDSSGAGADQHRQQKDQKQREGGQGGPPTSQATSSTQSTLQEYIRHGHSIRLSEQRIGLAVGGRAAGTGIISERAVQLGLVLPGAATAGRRQRQRQLTEEEKEQRERKKRLEELERQEEEQGRLERAVQEALERRRKALDFIGASALHEQLARAAAADCDSPDSPPKPRVWGGSG
jgi:hypothetical protein